VSELAQEYDVPTWPTIEHVQNELSAGEHAHATRIRRYDRAYEVYQATPPKGVRREPWESNLRVKYGMQVIDTAMVNIVTGPPRAIVKPRRPEDVESSRSMETILGYHVKEDHLAEKQPLFVQQALIMGVTAAKNHWVYRDQTRPFRRIFENPLGGTLEVEHEETVVLRDGPTFEPWDVYDIWWEPNARDVDTAGYIVLRSWLSKDELRRMTRTENNPYGLFDANAVDKLIAEGIGQQPQASAQGRMIGGTWDKRKDRFPVLEIWRDDTYTITDGGKRVVLNHDRNPYWHGRKPVVVAQVRPDLFEMQGISETELISDLQDGIQTVQNMVVDNMKFTVQRGITYRESGILDPSQLELRPRFKWPVTDHDDINFPTPPVLPPEAWREREVMKGDMQLISGINPYVSGSDMAGVDQSTATGVSTLASAASQLLRFKARMIAYKGIRRTFEQWGEMVQQFMDHDQDVRIEGPDGYDWSKVSPQEIVGNYDYDVEGVEEALSKQQARSELNGLLSSLQPFAQSPFVNWQAVLNLVERDWDLPRGTLFQKQQAPPPAAPTGQNGATGNGQVAPDPMADGGQTMPSAVQTAITAGGQQ
jgi:hypothetical protein